MQAPARVPVPLTLGCVATNARDPIVPPWRVCLRTLGDEPVAATTNQAPVGAAEGSPPWSAAAKAASGRVGTHPTPIEPRQGAAQNHQLRGSWKMLSTACASATMVTIEPDL